MIPFIIFLNFVATEPLYRIDVPRIDLQNGTRRILRGNEVGDTRPYMVWIRPASTATDQIEQDWMCGGVIIDERYILTSAACIEEVKHFYVVAGSRKWVSAKVTDNECVNNGQKKAVWKCVPRSYVFDGTEFDNIRWMVNDIAVVKVEDDFNFNRRIKGCDYIPKKIAYNNQSADLEKPKTFASTSGWGSTGYFSDVIVSPRSRNQEDLLETDVYIISKKICKKRWHERYHHIIDHYMICGKESMDTDAMTAACAQEVNCKELEYSEEEDDESRRHIRFPDPKHSHALAVNSRKSKVNVGGFCENDHGGPLVVGYGMSAVVIGVISANQIQDKTRQCHGPYLYTSVWNNRHLISCAIYKEMGITCRNLFRASKTQMAETFFTWRTHPDGPAKEELGTREHKRTSKPATESSNKTTGTQSVPLNITTDFSKLSTKKTKKHKK